MLGRATTPSRQRFNPAGLKMLPPPWEHDTFSWANKPESKVVSFRTEVNGTVYDMTITAREFVSDLRAQRKDVEGGDKCDRAFTLTLWNFDHRAYEVDGMPFDGPSYSHSASAGKSFRWREGTQITGVFFAYTMGLDAVAANALLAVLWACGHSVTPVDPETLKRNTGGGQ